MAIRSRRNFKTVLGAADLTLQAKAGESILIKDVRIFSPSITYANFLIERASVGYFRTVSVLGNHLPFHPGRSEHSHDMRTGSTAVAASGNGAILEDAGGTEFSTLRLADTAIDITYARAMLVERVSSTGMKTLLGYLWDKEIFKGYPVGEGETFTLDLITGATAVKIIEYEIYDAGDMTPDMENGSKANSYMYVNYGDSGGNIQAIADNVLNSANNPAEYPDFPFGGNVPSGHKIELLGILASDVAPAANVSGTATYMQYLKFMRDREVLFDEDHNGLLYFADFVDAVGNIDMIAEGYSVGGNYTEADIKEPFMFDPPLVFNEGEELTVSWHVVIAGAGAVISQALQEVALILRMSPMS